jgi:hypothetical protein
MGNRQKHVNVPQHNTFQEIHNSQQNGEQAGTCECSTTQHFLEIHNSQRHVFLLCSAVGAVEFLTV